MLRLLNRISISYGQRKHHPAQIEKTTRQGLSCQYLYDLKAFSGKLTSMNCVQKVGVRAFLHRIGELSTRQLQYIDLFIEALTECDDDQINDLVVRYRNAPEKLVQMIDFINIEIHRRDLSRQIQLFALVTGDVPNGPKFAAIYAYQGWTKNGRPRWPKCFRTDQSLQIEKGGIGHVLKGATV